MPRGLDTDSVVATSNTSRGGTGVGHELDPQPAEIGIPECLGIGYRRELATLPSPQAAWRICTLESPSQDERD